MARLSPLYDGVVRLFTRETAWRHALVAQVAPRSGDRILDVGCGTGSLAVLLKLAEPKAQIVGLDPDPAILARAEAKARAAGAVIEWRQGFARDSAWQGDTFDKAVSSLVFHQVPMPEKQAGIRAMIDAVRPGGEVHIADFARQRSRLMCVLFDAIGWVDGRENIRANAAGAIESILGAVSPDAAVPTRSFKTPLGEISLFRLTKNTGQAVIDALDPIAATRTIRWSL